MGEIYRFAVVSLEGQKASCRITEKGCCKKKFLQKHGAQPEAHHSRCDSGVTWQAGEVKRTEVRAEKKADLLAS